MSEWSLQTVIEFSNMPSTPEKEELSKAYLSDEISHYDFVIAAKRYIEKHKEN